MSAKELVFGAAVKMFKGEALEQLGYKKLGEAFQDSLQIGGGHKKGFIDDRTKACSICEEVKTYEMFSKHVTSRDGRTTRCKKCRSAIQMKRYHLNK